MHYVELDVNNLRRWLAGADRRRNAATGALPRTTTATSSTSPIAATTRTTRWRRRSRPASTATRTSINPTNAAGTANGDGVECRAKTSTAAVTATARQLRNVRAAARRAPNALAAAVRPWRTDDLTLLDATLVADARTDALSFRRAPEPSTAASSAAALKLVPPHAVAALVSTTRRSGPDDRRRRIPSTSRATTTRRRPASLTAGNVPAAIIADAVTLLSNNWNDIRSFNSPDAIRRDRVATTTGYRMAVVTGKGIPFPQPAGTDASFGSDGGAHNFVRSLEDWNDGATRPPLSRLDGQLLHQPPGRRHLQVLRHRTSTTAATATGRSTPTSCCPRGCRRARRCSATSTR